MSTTSILKKSGIVAALIILLYFIIFSSWCASFGCVAGVISVILLAGGVWFALSGKMPDFLPIVMLLWTILNLVLMGNSLNSYNKERDSYTSIVRSGGELSWRQKTNVFMLNIFMSLGAMPLYPEVAVESLLMIFPADHGIRRFDNSFFLQSEHIQRKIRNLKPGETARVSWNAQNYLLGMSEARYALALNPCRITRGKAGLKDIFEARVQVGYPEKSEVSVISWPAEFKIEEGLFNYLERRGWLHPYEAVWTGVNK